MKARPIPHTLHLTIGYGAETERQHAKTYSGMAHFAATGPLGTTCKDCVFYGQAFQRIRNTAGETIQTRRATKACGKFQALTGELGGNIPAHAEACTYFEPGEGA